MGYWKDLYEGGVSLLVGLGVTFRRIYKPVVTVQYPRERLVMSPAYRGHTELVKFPETGTHNCIACGMCEKMCPSSLITVQGEKITTPDGKSKKVGVGYLIDFNKCSLCGICVEVCPTGTLKFSNEYELVGESRDVGVIDLMERLRKQS